jgi:hypothetical protein
MIRAVSPSKSVIRATCAPRTGQCTDWIGMSGSDRAILRMPDADPRSPKPQGERRISVIHSTNDVKKARGMPRYQPPFPSVLADARMPHTENPCRPPDCRQASVLLYGLAITADDRSKSARSESLPSAL